MNTDDGGARCSDKDAMQNDGRDVKNKIDVVALINNKTILTS